MLLQAMFNRATLTILQKLQLADPAHGSLSLFVIVNLDDGHTTGSEACQLLCLTSNKGYKTLSTGVLNKTYPTKKEENLGMQA